MCFSLDTCTWQPPSLVWHLPHNLQCWDFLVATHRCSRHSHQDLRLAHQVMIGIVISPSLSVINMVITIRNCEMKIGEADNWVPQTASSPRHKQGNNSKFNLLPKFVFIQIMKCFCCCFSENFRHISLRCPSYKVFLKMPSITSPTSYYNRDGAVVDGRN